MQVSITLKVKVKVALVKKKINKRREGEKMPLSHNKGPQVRASTQHGCETDAKAKHERGRKTNSEATCSALLARFDMEF